MGTKLKIKRPTKIKTNKINMKMMINNDFAKIFEPMFEFEARRPNIIERSRPVQTFRCEKTCLNPENGTWEKSFSLEMLPTKAEDLKVKVEDGKLMITGKSETETKRDGFEIKSKHDWTRKIEIPGFVDPKKYQNQIVGEKLAENICEEKRRNQRYRHYDRINPTFLFCRPYT